MARLPITANIFDKKILPKVAKLVVAADSENSKQNRTVSTFEKSKVVNLRFFEKKFQKLTKKKKKKSAINFPPFSLFFR